MFHQISGGDITSIERVFDLAKDYAHNVPDGRPPYQAPWVHQRCRGLSEEKSETSTAHVPGVHLGSLPITGRYTSRRSLPISYIEIYKPTLPRFIGEGCCELLPGEDRDTSDAARLRTNSSRSSSMTSLSGILFSSRQAFVLSPWTPKATSSNFEGSYSICVRGIGYCWKREKQ